MEDQSVNLDLLRRAIPEDLVKISNIPIANDKLARKITLKEFYIWLGCHVFISCFPGFEELEPWWSKPPKDMFDGPPFRMGEFMSKYRFFALNSAIRLNDGDILEFVERICSVVEQDALGNKSRCEKLGYRKLIAKELLTNTPGA